MSITDELNQIIIQYQLNRFYPRFIKKLEAEKIIKDLALNTKEDTTILLVGTSWIDVELTRRLIGRYRQVRGVIFDKDKAAELPQAELAWANRILLVSFHGAEKVIETLEKRKVKFENLYEIFLFHELILEDEYHHFLGEPYENDYFDINVWERPGSNVQLEYYFIRKKFQGTMNSKLQNIYLEKMLFLALYMKNFIEAEKCVEELFHRECELDIRNAWTEIKDLLEGIRNNLLNRKCDDIVWFWMDALSFEDAEGMNYLNKMKENSLSFLNAFTNGAHTAPVLKAIFCQKRYVKDRSYKICVDRKNSEMISFLEEKGYQIKAISGYFTGDIITEELEIENKPGLYDPASMIFWSMLECLSLTNDNCFILAHAFIEIHPPCLSVKMCSLYNGNEMCSMGKRELDEQMKYYNSFLNENVMRIFMSDHGQRNADYVSLFHVHLDICHHKIKPQKIEGLFSLLDVYPMLRQLMDNMDLDINTFTREYVPIEALDIYNGRIVKIMLGNQNKPDLDGFGYVGVVSKDEIYLRFSMGKECQHSRADKRWKPLLFLENEIEDDSNLKQLRELAGEYPLEILQEDKFQYSRLFHRIYEIYKERSRELKNALNIYLNRLLEEYSDDSVGIRTGGLHSYYLYSLMEESVKRKVGFFIDQNPQCLCAVLERKVIPQEKISEEKIKLVILSSYDHRGILREEAACYPKELRVLDIYDVFEELGYTFTGNFFNTMGLREEDFRIMHNERR